ncbi:hypothetical protein JCM19992_33440 [Thermostilla marina]
MRSRIQSSVLLAWGTAVLLVCAGPVASSSADEKAPAKPAAESEKAGASQKQEKPSPYAWRNLFDGKTLKGWKAPEFGGEGKVEVKDGQIVMHYGDPMTGIVYTGKDFPKNNYEFEYEACRLDGSDFFATVTFPVGDEFCSFVNGGWGGTTIGISSVDFYDASDNITTGFFDFKDKQWYKFRVRVSDAKVEVWIDKEKVVDLVRKGHQFSTRFEVDLCKPFGFSTWMTTGAIRSIRVRMLKPEEVEDIALEAKERPF